MYKRLSKKKKKECPEQQVLVLRCRKDSEVQICDLK